MHKTRQQTITIKYSECENCHKTFDNDLTDDGMTGVFKCDKCGKECCSTCTGYYGFEFSIFKGNSGISIPFLYQDKVKPVLCLTCGSELEDSLKALGFSRCTKEYAEAKARANSRALHPQTPLKELGR
jgi:hypothetical protein